MTAAASQSVLLGWTGPGGSAWRYGLAQNGGAALSEQAFATAFQPIPFVAPQDQRFGLLWSDAAAVRAVALDGSTLTPTLSAGTGLPDQLVSSTWGGSLAGPVSVQADAQRAVIATSVRSQFSPGDSEARVHVIAELPWSAGPLAFAPQAVTRVPDMWPGTTPSNQSLLLFTDRALLLSWNAFTLKVLPVWRR